MEGWTAFPPAYFSHAFQVKGGCPREVRVRGTWWGTWLVEVSDLAAETLPTCLFWTGSPVFLPPVLGWKIIGFRVTQIEGYVLVSYYPGGLTSGKVLRVSGPVSPASSSPTSQSSWEDCVSRWEKWTLCPPPAQSRCSKMAALFLIFWDLAPLSSSLVVFRD